MSDSPKGQAGAVRGQIQQLILTQGLKPGDPMPTELELCEQLGVSRSSVREAMRTLAALDIVDVRHGTGTFVGHLSLTPMVHSVSFRSQLTPGEANEALCNIVGVRCALDLGHAEEVIKVMAGKTHPELAQLVDQMVEHSERGESFAAQDRAFHRLLLSQTSNALMTDLVDAFWEVHTDLLSQQGVATPQDITATAKAHGDMLAAAESGDVEGYRAATKAHYVPLLRVLERSRSN